MLSAPGSSQGFTRHPRVSRNCAIKLAIIAAARAGLNDLTISRGANATPNCRSRVKLLEARGSDHVWIDLGQGQTVASWRGGAESRYSHQVILWSGLTWCPSAAVQNGCNRCGAVQQSRMRIAIVDESAARASIIEEGLASVEGCTISIINGRDGLLARIAEIAPDIVLMDLGNPSRDELEEYFAVSRALDRPIAMFVDQSDDESIAASIDAGVSAYVVDGLASNRIRPLLDLAVRRFNAFARLQSDLAEAKGKLAERETIDRAKRILMDSKGISEPEAYAELRGKAMSSNRRIASIAEAIVTAHEMLGGQQ